MMPWDLNRYYPFKATNKECIQIVISLLNSYPLTKGCLEILGNKLKDRLEFGFFEGNNDIIRQSESGRDVFLLCSGTIDVLVDNRVVVQMFSPSLVGDKGIVSLNSQRAATIRISAEEQALVVKIPMEDFIRDFKNTKIPDESFLQEKSIFENVFENVQKRLFEYIYLQKSLWEQVTNTCNILNQQIVAMQLDNKKDPGWTDDYWLVAQNFLKDQYNISWPHNVSVNVQTLHAATRNFLDRKYAKYSKPDLASRKNKEWRNILTNISNRVLQNIPEKQRPIPSLDLELFNPNIYRMRLINLQKQLEKRYATKKHTEAVAKKNPPKLFFEKGERTNEFNLSRYLTYFNGSFDIKNPKRLLAQVAQKCALIAAECENNFNISAVKMQQFLEKVKSRNIKTNVTATDSAKDPSQVKSWITTLNRGIDHFRSTAKSIRAKELGLVHFDPNIHPLLIDILKTHRVKLTREQMSHAFTSLVNYVNFQSNLLSKEQLFQNFHLCIVGRGDTIPEKELKSNYWFPLSDDISFNHSGKKIANLKSCALIGYEAIGTQEDDPGKDSETAYDLTAPHESLLLVLPQSNCPWFQKDNPAPQAFIEQYLPFMQWLINKYFEQFLHLKSQRDNIVQEWMEIRNGIERSEKIALFEQKPLKIPKDDHFRIINWLSRSFGMKLDASDSIVSSQISKRIYNFFVQSTTTEHPDLSIEQKGNLAYTKWRNLLFELVDQIPALNKAISAHPGKAPRPVLNILTKQLTPLLSPLMKETWQKRNPITSGTPSLNILSIFHPEKHESCKAAIKLFKNVLDIFAKNVSHLIKELQFHNDLLAEFSKKRDYTDVSGGQSAVQIDIRKESIQQLIKILQNLSLDK